MEIMEKKSIFWDVDAAQIDPVLNGDFIIGRVLNYGDISDFKWLMKQYEPEKIRRNIQNSRILDPKSKFFWRQYFNLKEQECSPKQSTAKPGAFWKR